MSLLPPEDNSPCPKEYGQSLYDYEQYIRSMEQLMDENCEALRQCLDRTKLFMQFWLNAGFHDEDLDGYMSQYEECLEHLCWLQQKFPNILHYVKEKSRLTPPTM